jgi:hypothetical protein
MFQAITAAETSPSDNDVGRPIIALAYGLTNGRTDSWLAG